jgi:hypothetical protein
MSDDTPLLSKMDALLKKHRGENDPVAVPLPAASSSAPPAWLPVLTQVIERGAVPGPASPPSLAMPPATDAIATPQPSTEPAPLAHIDVQSLLHTLLPQWGDDLKQQITHDVHAQIDQALTTFSSQLEIRLREILREALTPPRD